MLRFDEEADGNGAVVGESTLANDDIFVELVSSMLSDRFGCLGSNVCKSTLPFDEADGNGTIVGEATLANDNFSAALVLSVLSNRFGRIVSKVCKSMLPFDEEAL